MFKLGATFFIGLISAMAFATVNGDDPNLADNLKRKFVRPCTNLEGAVSDNPCPESNETHRGSGTGFNTNGGLDSQGGKGAK